MIYTRNISICSIDFVIEENLGIRSLRCTQPGFTILNTFLSIVQKQDDIIQKIIAGADIATQDIDAALVDKTAANSEEIPALFRGTENDGPPLYKIAIYGLTGTIILPLPFLKKVAETSKRITDKSRPDPPPWLFREISIHSTPCLLPGYEEVERHMMQRLNEEILKTVPDIGAIPAMILNPRPVDLALFLKTRLTIAGLLSEQYFDEKIYWLYQFNCDLLARLYEVAVRQIKEKQSPEAAIKTKDQLPNEDAGKIESQLTRLAQFKQARSSEKDWMIDPEITALTRFLYFDLDCLNLLMIENGNIIRRVSVDDNYPLLQILLKKITGFIDYARSPARASYFPTGELTKVTDLPFSLLWFSLDELPAPATPMEWLTRFEYYFKRDIVEPGIYFFKEAAYRLEIKAGYDDGIQLRILSAKEG